MAMKTNERMNAHRLKSIICVVSLCETRGTRHEVPNESVEGAEEGQFQKKNLLLILEGKQLRENNQAKLLRGFSIRKAASLMYACIGVLF